MKISKNMRCFNKAKKKAHGNYRSNFIPRFSICMLVFVASVSVILAGITAGQSHNTFIPHPGKASVFQTDDSMCQSVCFNFEDALSSAAVTHQRLDNPRFSEPRNLSHDAAAHYFYVKMKVTAYCPCRQCCGQFADGITASGHRIIDGDRFAAADRSVPFGTRLRIPGYARDSPIKVLDRGGKIKGCHIDVFFNTHQEALDWGVQYLEVKVIE